MEDPDRCVLLRELFFIWQIGDTFQLFLSYYLPLRSVVVERPLIDAMSNTKEKEDLFPLLLDPRIVFDPRIKDGRVQNFIDIIKPKIQHFTVGEAKKYLQPLLSKAIEFGNVNSFELMHRYRLLEKENKSANIFISLLDKEKVNTQCDYLVFEYCSRFHIEEPILSWMRIQKKAGINSKEYFIPNPYTNINAYPYFNVLSGKL